MRVVKFFVVLLVLAFAGAGGAYYVAGRAAGPVVVIHQPDVVGQASAFDVTIDAPDGRLVDLAVNIRQGDTTFPVLALATAPAESISREGDNRVRVRGPIGRRSVPDLRTGPAQIIVSAARPVLWGLRQASSHAARDVQVRLEPPRISVVSTKHYINVGGSELVVYRASPPDVESGVRVGGLHVSGIPASAAGVPGDPELKVAFFALLYNQPPGDADQALRQRRRRQRSARGVRPSRVSEDISPQRDSDRRSVSEPSGAADPAAVAEVKRPPTILLPAFLKVNNDLRGSTTRRSRRWRRRRRAASSGMAPFNRLAAQVESAFADYRTYTYGGKEVDHQVHLGFDLAKPSTSPVTPGNDGKVIHAHSSASTATASSSTTGWACSHSTVISRHSRCTRATR